MFQDTTQATMSDRQRRIYQFIKANPTGVLASVDPNGEPHAAVIYHVIDDRDFGISFLTKKATKKYDNLIHQNRVVLVVFDAARQTVAQVFGKAEEVTKPETINLIANAVNQASLKTSKQGILPIAKLEAGDYAGFRILPTQIRMAVYTQPKSGNGHDAFESIESFELRPEA